MVSATSSSTPYTLPISVPPDQASSTPGYIGFGSVPIGGNSYTGFTQPINNGSSTYFTIAPLPVLSASDFLGTTCYSPDWRNPCTTTLTFSPTATGLRTAIITTTPSTGVFKAYGVGGSGGDDAAFTITENDFPDQIVPGYIGTVTLSNVGAAPLLLYREISTTNPVHFGLTSAGCSLNNSIRVADPAEGGYGQNEQGVYLAVGQSCTVGVSFNVAQGAGHLIENLKFTDAISGVSQSLTLNGDAGTSENAPTVSQGVDVGNVALHTPTTPSTFTINAPNGEGVMVTATVREGNGLTYTLDAGSCANMTPCQATLSVTPASSGRFEVDITAYDPTTGLSAISSLSGNAGFPVATFSPASLDLGAQTVGTTATKQVTVTNTGQVPLTVTSVTLTSDTAADFAFDISNCKPQGGIVAGGTCTVQVYFTPHGTGTRSGTLQFVSNELTPSSLALTGTGTQ
jgi:hypothetical protein